MDLKRGIDKAVSAVVANIKAQSKEVGDNFDKIDRWHASRPTNDPEIGSLIAEAMKKVSKEGVITIEEAKGTDTHIDVVEGMQFDRWLPLRILRDQRRKDGSRIGKSVCVDP
jgi:chaperonin GroEL